MQPPLIDGFVFSPHSRLVRHQILEQDFACNVKLLQNYPSTDINVILAKASNIR